MSEQPNATASANEATAILKRINKTERHIEATARETAEHATNSQKHASIALEKSNEAVASAKSAHTSAEETYDNSVNSKAKADEASSNATIAKTKLDEIASSATVAKTKEDDVINSANSAKNKEAEAVASAATAKAKLDEITTNASNAKLKTDEATDSAKNAKTQEDQATESAQNAKTKEDEITTSSENATLKEGEATASAENAKIKEIEATDSATNAKTSEENARDSAEQAEISANEAAKAHNMSVTTGLAGAFNVKAISALKKMTYATIGLIASLALIIYIGIGRYNEVVSLLSTQVAEGNLLEALLAQILFFLIGAGAPIWLAWLSTRMMSKYFQISEDYAYKASLAEAYVGFRDQAKELDPIFEERLFAAAITQLDANPLRFFEDTAHASSPIQDLLQQPFMRSAMKSNLGFKDSLSTWMNERFKTNFYVEKVDLLKATSNKSKKVQEEIAEVADQIVNDN